jgi:hypothetical protein
LPKYFHPSAADGLRIQAGRHPYLKRVLLEIQIDELNFMAAFWLSAFSIDVQTGKII